MGSVVGLVQVMPVYVLQGVVEARTWAWIRIEVLAGLRIRKRNVGVLHGRGQRLRDHEATI